VAHALYFGVFVDRPRQDERVPGARAAPVVSARPTAPATARRKKEQRTLLVHGVRAEHRPPRPGPWDGLWHLLTFPLLARLRRRRYARKRDSRESATTRPRHFDLDVVASPAQEEAGHCEAPDARRVPVAMICRQAAASSCARGHATTRPRRRIVFWSTVVPPAGSSRMVNAHAAHVAAGRQRTFCSSSI